VGKWEIPLYKTGKPAAPNNPEPGKGGSILKGPLTNAIVGHPTLGENCFQTDNKEPKGLKGLDKKV